MKSMIISLKLEAIGKIMAIRAAIYKMSKIAILLIKVNCTLAQHFTTSNIMSKTSSKNFSNGKVFPENWHFNSCFVLKTTKTTLFVFITEIL